MAPDVANITSTLASAFSRPSSGTARPLHEAAALTARSHVRPTTAMQLGSASPSDLSVPVASSPAPRTSSFLPASPPECCCANATDACAIEAIPREIPVAVRASLPVVRA